MSFLFGRTRPRSPAEIARLLKDLLARVRESPASVPPKLEDELAKQLSNIKILVQGTQDIDPVPEHVHRLTQAFVQEDLLYDLACSIEYLPFEARKDVQTIFSHMLRFRPPRAAAPTYTGSSSGSNNSISNNGSSNSGGGSSSSSSSSSKNNESATSDPPVITYIVNKRPEILIELCHGYNRSRSAMTCGSILREALKVEVSAAVILHDESSPKNKARVIRLSEIQLRRKQTGEGVFWEFFDWINKSSFEVSADAFTTFRDLLTKHKALVAGYLSANFDLFFERYNSTLMQSSSYVTKRQSIKLLGELLLDRANYSVMTRYVDSGDHLKLCMNLLRDDRKMVQYEGFHIFKVGRQSTGDPSRQVFVANPNKSVAVQRILINNRSRLLRFLPKFLEDRTDDDQFMDEKSFLVRQIELLPPEPVEPNPPTRTTATQPHRGNAR
ncbi:hypothetical protein KEM52_001088 [Ascosphaera acerosa]|nr:hypothetical protein KEM52_001088 [Ascosphaera acerosa]